jgi:gamma-glutamylcyclotransferase (GGCT)/AIG2-like uncharacterized protein YtfP
MALVFQYGSNMSVARLNHTKRLAGEAKPIGIARTVEPFELMFTVYSKTNSCAAADIVPSENGRSIYGVLYEIPDFLLSRDTAKEHSRKSLDAIEGEGVNYIRRVIQLIKSDGSQIRAITYVVKDRKTDIKTSFNYVVRILCGLQEHNVPEEYHQYVVSQIIKNNCALVKDIYKLTHGA